MNKGLLLVGGLLVLQASGVFASCSDPRLLIEVVPDAVVENRSFDMNLIYSANPPPIVPCICPFGQDCGFKWEYFTNGSWTQIPSSQSVDLNCSSDSCNTGTSYPIEDREYTRTISCAGIGNYQVKGFLLRGTIPFLDKSTSVIHIPCYRELACVPPSVGNFFLNQTCSYKDFRMSVDGNYHILVNGHAIHHSSDVNFTSADTHFLKIQNGGQIDLNQSLIFTGLTKGSGLALGGLFLILLLIFFGNRFVGRHEVFT